MQPLLRLETYDVERINTKFLNSNPAKCTHNFPPTYHLQGPVIVLVIWPLIIHISLIRTDASVQ